MNRNFSKHRIFEWYLFLPIMGLVQSCQGRIWCIKGTYHFWVDLRLQKQMTKNSKDSQQGTFFMFKKRIYYWHVQAIPIFNLCYVSLFHYPALLTPYISSAFPSTPPPFLFAKSISDFGCTSYVIRYTWYREHYLLLLFKPGSNRWTLRRIQHSVKILIFYLLNEAAIFSSTASR